MNEAKASIGSAEEVQHLLDRFIEREPEEMPTSAFWSALAEIEAEKEPVVVEITGQVEGDQLTFSLPAYRGDHPVSVLGNQIRLGDQWKVVVTLQPAVG